MGIGDMCIGPDSSLCDKNISIPRTAIPQLDQEVTAKFINSYQRKNIAVERETVPAATLYATYNQLLRSKVVGMVKIYNESTFNPCQEAIIVAKHGDNHVLDGHHRWAACRLVGGEITVTRIDQPIEKLLRKANNFWGSSIMACISSALRKMRNLFKVKQMQNHQKLSKINYAK